MTAELTAALDPIIAGVSEIPDAELQGVADVLERGLIHLLVEQQMRVSASVSPLRSV